MLGKVVQVAAWKKIFINKNFSFSFENLRIFEDIWRICNLRRSSKNFWINEDSSYSSSVHFKKPKNLHIRLRSIFNLRCNTATSHHTCLAKITLSRGPNIVILIIIMSIVFQLPLPFMHKLWCFMFYCNTLITHIITLANKTEIIWNHLIKLY